MNQNLSNILASVIASAVAFSGFSLLHSYESDKDTAAEKARIGYVFDGDGSNAYTANFMTAVNQISSEYGDSIEIIERYHVPYEAAEGVIAELADQGCDLIVTNSYAYVETAKKAAEKYPDIQFCAATGDNANEEPVLSNYHTFMGEIYQGRYTCGVIAGRKLQNLIDTGQITEDQAVIGYVAAYPLPEVISGYTAFLLGVRSQCASAVMRVRYTNTWTGYAIEKTTAEQLISEGCRLIAQHSDTIGPALACENADLPYPVYHVGYNRDMTEVAPTVSLISTRIDWYPYLLAATKAVISHSVIESNVNGTVHGNDVSGGFAEGWVSMFQLNAAAAAPDSEQLLDSTQMLLRNHSLNVFYGEYTGTDPENPDDTYDLRLPYAENDVSSAPTFHYVLDDIITVE